MSGLTKFFYSTMKGAPVLAAEWGSMLNVCRTVFVEGFNPQIATNVTIVDGEATITLPLEHGFIEHQVVAISGANEVDFNTEFRVKTVTDTTITISTTIDVPTTGEVTVKTAPLGWTEKFTGEMKAVFTAKDTVKNPFYLRIDNSCPVGYDTTWAKFARVTMSNGIVDIDDYSDFVKAPTIPGNASTNENGNGITGAGGVFGWAKWYHGVNTYPYLNEANVSSGQIESFEYEIVGDAASFYFNTKITDVSGRAMYSFTPFASYGKTDTYNCFMSATNHSATANSNGEYYNTGRNNAQNSWTSHDSSGKYILRGFDGANDTHVTCGLLSLNLGNNLQVSGYNNEIPFPNRADNSVICTDIYIKEGGSWIRGVLPIVKWVGNRWIFSSKIVINTGDKKVLILASSYNATLTSYFAYELEG